MTLWGAQSRAAPHKWRVSTASTLAQLSDLPEDMRLSNIGCQNILGYSCKGRFNTLFERCIWGEAGAVLRLESNFLPSAWSYFLHSIETYQYDSLL